MRKTILALTVLAAALHPNARDLIDRLVAEGIEPGRIETTTGGDNDPVDSNATASGRAENRRTELVVTQR